MKLGWYQLWKNDNIFVIYTEHILENITCITENNSTLEKKKRQGSRILELMN